MTIYVLSCLMGLWLIFDGIHVLLKGQYFGLPEPGPWSKIVEWLGINPFSLGIPFVLLGVLWLVGVTSLYMEQIWAVGFLSFVSIASLWYLPLGTVLSAVVLLLLWIG